MFGRFIRSIVSSAIIAALLSACAIKPTQTPFPDYGYAPPTSEYSGPLFKLSQNYPTQMPDKSKLPGFLNTDFTQDWRAYIMQVRDYCFEGNVAADWRVENNKVRGWYHIPWQHYGPMGREAIHGLTKEAPLAAGQLASSQLYTNAVAYAVGFYNEFGGYTIGKVWKDHTKPDPSMTTDEGFPVGTVVCKTLFVNMPPDLVKAQVPFLANPVTWQAYVTKDFSSCVVPGVPCERSVMPVALIQMDIMVRDDRAPFGWVFGTFQYNGQLNNAAPWNNLVPVGLQWGNDPEVQDNIPQLVDGTFPQNTPAAITPINAKLTNTRINNNASELPPTHLGWDGRLNGPVDNPRSSCMSCHMTASYPGEPLSGLFVKASDRPQSGTPEWNTWWLQWFQNVRCRELFLNAKQSLDFSLQLSGGIQNFYASEQSPVRVTPQHPTVRNAAP